MSKSLFKPAAAAARCLRFLTTRFAALVVVLTLAGSLAGVLSATSAMVSARGGSDPGNGIVLANGGTGAGGDPGNGIVHN
jgi:hypothetical protein